MDRFAIKITDKQISVLSEKCREYEIPPVTLTPNGFISYHPHEINGAELVILFCWRDELPISVYRHQWFDKSDPNNWTLKPNRKSKIRREWDKKQRGKPKKVPKSNKLGARPQAWYNE